MNLRSDYGCRNLQVYIAINKRGAEKGSPAFDLQKWRTKIGARPGIFAREGEGRRRNETKSELYSENKWNVAKRAH